MVTVVSAIVDEDISRYAVVMRTFLVVAAAALSLSCASTPPTVAAQVKADGAFVSGAPKGLGEPQIVNRRDFIYALAFGKDDTLAFVHHVTRNMELTAAQYDPLRPRFQQPVNASEFDVEDVAILDDGPGKGSIAVPSRQGIARAFDSVSGKQLREYIAGVGLIRLAESPKHDVVAFGSTDGRVLFLDPGSFALLGQSRIHDGEIHGLAFLPDGKLVSTSFDGTLKISKLVPSGGAAVHIAATALKTGERVFLAHLDGTRAIATVRDTRQPNAAVTSAAVKRLSLLPTADGKPLDVVTAEGSKQLSPVSLGHVHISTLDLGSLDAAVCDECVPPGAELVLGQTALARALFVDDIARDELVVRPTDAENHATESTGALALSVESTIALPGPGTDVDVAKDGTVLVSFSHAKAERSFDLYDSEKKGIYPDPSPKSAAAIVDVARGTLGKQFVGHRGFTVTAAISPDGRTVVTGGWDKRVLVFDAMTGEKVTERQLAWLVRRVRFSPDGHLLGVAAWTPVNAFNEGDSDPALLLYPMSLEQSRVVAGR
jgi:WD40 repeat protein